MFLKGKKSVEILENELQSSKNKLEKECEKAKRYKELKAKLHQISELEKVLIFEKQIKHVESIERKENEIEKNKILFNQQKESINKEITVLFGGARALLMHAAHPLIAAGARQTSFYQRDPWKRLIRTLSLQNSVTFGTKEEADESAHRINKLHEVIKGEDEITGGYYDALDHEQLLWVHACLQISSIYFYEKTVKNLTEKRKKSIS